MYVLHVSVGLEWSVGGGIGSGNHNGLELKMVKQLLMFFFHDRSSKYFSTWEVMGDFFIKFTKLPQVNGILQSDRRGKMKEKTKTKEAKTANWVEV